MAGLLQLLCLDAGEHQLAQAVGIAVGRDHLGKSGAAGGGGGVFADREQRQLEQPAAGKMRLDAAQRIGAGDDDRAIARIGIVVERDRLEPQHRRQQHLKAPGAQARGGGLVVRMRARDENGHVTRPPTVAAADDCTCDLAMLEPDRSDDRNRVAMC